MRKLARGLVSILPKRIRFHLMRNLVHIECAWPPELVLKCADTKEELEGQTVVVVANLETKKMMGEESQGMIICAVEGEAAKLIPVPKTISAGSTVR